MANVFVMYGDDEENIKNRSFDHGMNQNDMNGVNIYDTPNGKHTIFTSLMTNKNMNILPTGHMTAKGGKGPFARFIIKSIEATPGGGNVYDNIKTKKK